MTPTQELLEALKAALDATTDSKARATLDAAIAAFREQAERVEPVAVRHSFDGYGWMFTDNGDGSSWLENGMKMPNAELLYTTPPSAAVSEPVNCDRCVYHYKDADQKPCDTCIHSRDFVSNFEPRNQE